MNISFLNTKKFLLFLIPRLDKKIKKTEDFVAGKKAKIHFTNFFFKKRTNKFNKVSSLNNKRENLSISSNLHFYHKTLDCY